MSGNAHQRRVRERRFQRHHARFQAWIKANMQRIAGGDCDQCKIGRVRRVLFAPRDSGRECDLCGWQPAGEPPPYKPALDYYVPTRSP